MTNAATSRQLWALFCITKHDYRNENLTREEASNLIEELKNRFPARKDKKESKQDKLEVALNKYFKENIMPTVVASLRGAIGIESEVVEDTNFMQGTGKNGAARSYKFRGFGCSMSWLEYDKRSKKAVHIDELMRKHKNTTWMNMVIKQFPARIVQQLKEEGTPFDALYSQDMDVNSTLFNGVVRFAKEMGVKNIDYVTRLD